MDGFFNTPGCLYGYLDGIIGAYADTTATTSTSIAYNSSGIHQAYGFGEADVLGTCSASFTPIRHSHGDPGHFFNLVADSVVKVGQYAP